MQYPATLTSCRICSFYSSVAADASPLGYDAVLLGENPDKLEDPLKCRMTHTQ
jgi:hypothetical protein